MVLGIIKLHWSKELYSVILWGVVFLTFELLPILWKGCPWTTFTGTIRGAIAWWHVLAIWLAVIFVILFGHFEEGWRVRYVIAWALITIIGIIMHVLLP